MKAWRPTPVQEKFLRSAVAEVLYGGAAGGGKSESLLVAAARWVGNPNYRALLLRRTYDELEESIIDRSTAFYRPLGGSYNQGRHRWIFPSGARIRFASIEHEKDVDNFRSAEFSFIGFDELTTFVEHQWTFLLSRLRSTDPELPCFIRGCTNPGGVGHDWVLKRWRWWLYEEGKRTDEFDGPYAAPNEKLWILRDPHSGDEQPVEPMLPLHCEACEATWVARGPAPPEEEEGCDHIVATSRTFQPAFLRDNPYLAKTDYGARLNGLDPLTRAQQKEGDWMARPAPGMFFRRAWVTLLDAPPAPQRARIRYWDRAATEPNKDNQNPDFTAGVLMSQSDNGRVCIEDVARCRREPAETEAFIVEVMKADKEAHGKIPQVLEQDPGSAGKYEVRNYQERYPQFDIQTRHPTGDKVTRYKPFSGAAFRKEIDVVRGDWNGAYFAEQESFPEGKKDQADATSGGYQFITGYSSRAPRARGKRPLARAPGGF
jgi:predicted phage terminase large subunit-like protein